MKCNKDTKRHAHCIQTHRHTDTHYTVDKFILNIYLETMHNAYSMSGINEEQTTQEHKK